MSSGQEVGSIFGDGTGPTAALLRSPTVIITSIALWGMNVCLFRLFGIDYVHVLLLDLKKEEGGKDKILQGHQDDDKEEEEKEGERGIEMKNNTKKLLKGKLKTRVIKRGNVTHIEVPTNEMKADEFDEMDLALTEEIDHSDHSSKIGGEIEMNGLSMISDSDEDSLINVSLDLSPSSKEAKKTVSSSSNNNEITDVKLISLAGGLIMTLYLTSYFWIQVGRGSTIGAIFCFYILVLIGVLLPFPSTNWIRFACKTVFVRVGALLKPRCSCIHGRPKPVPFIDVFVADGMCSLSKVFFDWGMLWLLASHYPHPVPPSLQSIVVPSCFASLPYIIRARQCLIMYNVGKRKNSPTSYQHVLNAIKYSTSLFPLIVSAFKKTTYGEQFSSQAETVLIVLLIVNATYCLTWDIVMDWGMMQNPNAIMEHAVGQCMSKGISPLPPSPISLDQSSPDSNKRQARNCLDKALRPRLRFGTTVTLLIVFLDTFLRFSWTLRFYEHAIFPSNDAYILCTEFLEVFRRAVWNLLRVEWEHIKQTRVKTAA